jgi:hypothetical protein
MNNVFLASVFSVLSVASLAFAGPFDPAPPVDPEAPAEARCCDCRDCCRKLERELAELKAQVKALEQRVKKPKQIAELAPGVEWRASTFYERGPDGLIYYRDQEPRAPKVQLVPVLTK